MATHNPAPNVAPPPPTSSTANPNAGDTRKMGLRILAVIIAAVLLGLVIRLGLKVRNPEYVAVPITSTTPHPLGTFTIPITREWSREIYLGVGQLQRKIDWWTTDNDTPYTVLINGGKGEGGFEEKVPSRVEAARTNWKPTWFPDQIIKVRFRLDECDKKESAVTVNLRH